MLNQRGQSTVEYVLLLATVMFLVSIVLRSPLFADLMGENSSFFGALKERMEYSYRYTQTGSGSDSGREDFSNPSEHKSYTEGGSTRFSGLTEPYGE